MVMCARYTKHANEGVRNGTSGRTEVQATLEVYPTSDMGIWYTGAMEAFDEQVVAGELAPDDEDAVKALFITHMPSTVKADYDAFLSAQ